MDKEMEGRAEQVAGLKEEAGWGAARLKEERNGRNGTAPEDEENVLTVHTLSRVRAVASG